MSKVLVFALSFVLATLTLVTEVKAQARALSKPELLEGIQHWRNILRNIPGSDLRENDLQQEFLFRLQFFIERRYEGNDGSMIRILEFMQDIENQPINLSSSSLGPFLGILIKSLKEAREPQEELWPYVQQFMVDNSLRNPVAFEDTLKQRDYFNQFETVSARRLSAEEINQFFIVMETPTTAVLNSGQGPNIGKLQERPGAELPAEARAPQPPERQSDVRLIEIIDGQNPALKP